MPAGILPQFVGAGVPAKRAVSQVTAAGSHSGTVAIAGSIAAKVAQGRFDTAEQLAVLVHNAAPHLDPTAASAYAHAISGAAEQLAKWWRQHPDTALDDVVGYHLDTVWSGLQQLIR